MTAPAARRPVPFYSRDEARELDEGEAVSLAQWRAANEGEPKSFALAGGGFGVFLSPDALDALEEYEDTSLYRTEENLGSVFHRARVAKAREFLDRALARMAAEPVVNLLDVGCGEAAVLAEVLVGRAGISIFGVDGAFGAIERAASRLPHARFAVADATRLPVPPASFDVVTCLNLFEHVEAPTLLVREIARSLRPGGLLVLSTPSRYRIENAVRVLRGERVFFMSRAHVTEYSVGQVCEMLERVGFVVEAVDAPPVSAALGSLPKRFVLPLAKRLLRLVRSPHVLEPTAFFLARWPGVGGGEASRQGASR